MSLGPDRQEVIRKVLEMERRAPDTGTVAEMVGEYLASGDFKKVGERTKADYLVYSKHTLRVFGGLQVTDLQPPHIARYLRIERKEAPV
ncbi:hypothetical protein [Achromobacter aloeverae]|uniref:Integrase n=1 Tax=Achromobacter aloeverae TaxID=1750518 RepID=A0A4Q1HQM7_9BURK|nr:hypothetical protein [Achromobacter aloeverae]RXN93404.1 hypothetical protein C7R54_06860 [Achromobacter aloeverae]